MIGGFLECIEMGFGVNGSGFGTGLYLHAVCAAHWKNIGQ